jgi:cell division septum initiation protein DivIVA
MKQTCYRTLPSRRLSSLVPMTDPSSHGGAPRRVYDGEQVDAYLSDLHARLAELERDSEQLEARLAAATARAQTLEAEREALSRALIRARQMADAGRQKADSYDAEGRAAGAKALAEARHDAERIVDEARRQAASLVSRARADIEHNSALRSRELSAQLEASYERIIQLFESAAEPPVDERRQPHPAAEDHAVDVESAASWEPGLEEVSRLAPPVGRPVELYNPDKADVPHSNTGESA